MKTERCIVLKELYSSEIYREHITEYATEAFKRRKSYPFILEHFAKVLFPNWIEDITQLEQCTDPSDLKRLYLKAKREYWNTKIWYDINLQALEDITEKPQEGRKEEIYAYFDKHLPRIERFTEAVLSHEEKVLPKNYDSQRKAIDQELDKIVQETKHFDQYPKEQQEIYKQKFEKAKKELTKIVELVRFKRLRWVEEILEDGRGRGMSYPDLFAYPLMYTVEGHLYITLESPEHFLGVGEGKIVCRTVHLDKGEIVALIKARTQFNPEKEQDQEKAAEEIDKRNKAFQSAWREANFLMRLNGKEGIIFVYDRIAFESQQIKYLYLVEKKYEGGSLSKAILADIAKPPKERRFTIPVKAQLAKHLLKGLVHTHAANIIHRDIKSANVLLDFSDPQHPQAVLCDYNLACFKDEIVEHARAAFSPANIAPEYAAAVLSEKSKKILKATSFKIDVWSLGIVFFSLFFDIPVPWMIKEKDESAMEFTALYKKILQKVVDLTPEWFLDEWKELPFAPLVQKMLTIDPKQRPTSKEALEEFEMARKFYEKDA